jgi:lysophospholipase L1-like esterase
MPRRSLLPFGLDPSDLALVLLVAPLFVGFVAGNVVRVWRGSAARSVALAVGLLLASVGLAAVVGPNIRLGIWDSALIGLLAGIGLVAGLFAWHDHPAGFLLGMASFGLTLGAAELAVRLAMPSPPGFPALEGASLFIPRVDLEHADPTHGDFTEFHRQAVDGCSLLYPETHPAHVDERTKRDRDATGSVVYLGDSMTYGLGVRLYEAFPAMLEKRTPSLFHFNLGFPGTSVDYHFMVARHWLDRIQPPVKLVVIGLYFNDILEIGQGMPCCQDRSLLTFDGDAPAERCPEPSWVKGYGESISWFVRHSPPPFPVRVAMEYSYMARYLGALIMQRASEAIHSDRPQADVVWERMGLVLAALRDGLARRNIPLVAVVLPTRAALEADDPSTYPGYRDSERMKELAMSLGIRTLDPWNHFLALVKRDGSSRYFLGGNDIHFTVEGHIEMADWLAANVDEIRAATTVAAGDPRR